MYHIISNPISGRKKTTNKKVLEIYKYLNDHGINYCLYETKYFEHPLAIAKEITEKYESGNIIVIGGDGTFNEVLNGIKDLSKWNIGLIPSGSGNDFAKAINLPIKDLIGCLKIILNNNLKQVDYIKVNDKICVNVLGTGIDVEVLLNFEKHKKLKGSFRYLYSLIESLIHIKWHEFDVSIDDKEFEHKKGFIITLCNGSNIGGGIPICPNANPMDQKLEFVYVRQVKKIKIPRYLFYLLKGKILTLKEVEHIYCQKAVFKSDRNLTIQIDGNITDNSNIYTCELVSKGLNMYL